MDTVMRPGRSGALAAFVAAGILVGLIVSLAGGSMPEPAVLDALSIGSAAGALVVLVLAFASVAPSAWGQAGRALAVSGLTLVLAGDALQAVALRGSEDSALLWSVSFVIRDGIGNGLFYASLLIVGALLWSAHRWVGGLAIANGVLGYLAMAFADRLGLPPHLNFLLLVVWFAGLGVAWWRSAAHPRDVPAALATGTSRAS